MTSNRFSDCIDIGGVLRLYRQWKSGGDMKPVHADAVARIAELSRTPVVVDGDARERARKVISELTGFAASAAWLDRIIDALGYTARVVDDALAESKPHAKSPTPAVELNESDLKALGRHLEIWCEFALLMDVPPTASVPICVGEIVQNDGGTWVLRIGSVSGDE